MQFTGHPLPVPQFVTAPWDFNPVPYCQPSSPTQSLPITGQRNMQLPPSLEWHVWLGRRSIYNKTTNKHLTRENLDVGKKRKLQRETESLLIAAQNNTVRTNHIKARTDMTQQNSKCSLCGDRDEMINHIRSECCKLAQKEYKT